MRTKEMLEKMPQKNREYLEMLKENVKIAKERGLENLSNEHKIIAKGYIRALADCGVIDDFKVAWCWFTL